MNEGKITDHMDAKGRPLELYELLAGVDIPPVQLITTLREMVERGDVVKSRQNGILKFARIPQISHQEAEIGD